jgi:hypothetical protein
MFAYAAYCPKDQLAAWTCKWCNVLEDFELYGVLEIDALQVFAGWDPEYSQIVVSFRGTHNARDAMYDIDAIWVDYPGVSGGTVHQGFYNAWEDMKPTVMQYVQALMAKHANKQILVTGHSMGASIAQIASLDIFSLAQQSGSTGYRVVQDFGSPRWGNPAMVDYFTSLADVHWRIVNKHDIVPTVPPEGSHYHHTPNEVWYTEYDPKLVYQICDGTGEDPNCSYFGTSIYDHLHYLNVEEDCS